MNATGLDVGDGTDSLVIVTESNAGDGDADTNARAGTALIDTAIKNVNIQRSELGAVSNRAN
jgi:flagellin-like hook-associated protein FlgL